MIRRLLVVLAVAPLALLAGCRDIPVPSFPASMTTPPGTSASATTSTATPTTTTAPTTTSSPPSGTTTRTTSPRPTTSLTISVEPPPTPPGAPPSEDGVSAAEARGWGQPVAGDEFNTGAKPDSRWGMYDGEGHAGNGRRTPTAFSIADGLLRVHGDASGNSGGMAYRDGQFRGRWEARMRVPAGDKDYHPVLLLWPDAEDFPVGGEVDYAETTAASKEIEFFLHYGASNSQTHGEKALDLTGWHNYAVDWTASCITGYVDNQQFFQDCNRGHLPPRSMHATIQLDAFNGRGPYTPTDMFVDWIRQYAP